MEEKRLKLKKIKGTENSADIGTKVLTGPEIEKCHQLLNYKNVAETDTFGTYDDARRLLQVARVSSGSASSGRVLQVVASLLAATGVASSRDEEYDYYVESAVESDQGWSFVTVVVLTLLAFAAGVCLGIKLHYKFGTEIRIETKYETVLVERDPPSTRSKNCQSHCTYKYKWSKPEFRPLSEMTHGGWNGDD